MPIAAGILVLLALTLALARRRRPAPVDPYAEHDPASACDPTPRPGTLAFRAWVLGQWSERPGSPQNISRACSGAGRLSEHHEGRAWDMMIPLGQDGRPDAAIGQAVVDALLAPDPNTEEPHALARRAGIMYMIWRGRMWRAYPWAGQARGTWTPYGGESPHEDHVHFSLSRAGAAGETSLYRSTI